MCWDSKFSRDQRQRLWQGVGQRRGAPAGIIAECISAMRISALQERASPQIVEKPEFHSKIVVTARCDPTL